MTLRRFALLAFASTWLLALSGVAVRASAETAPNGTSLQTSGATASVEAPTPPAKPKKTKIRHPLKPATATPAPVGKNDAPLQLNFDPLKSVVLRPEPSSRYQATLPPQVASRGDDQQAHLAPMLRETTLPDSFGDHGSFIDRHEFGIQLKDHF